MATKAENLSNPNSCFSKAADDEPIFVLRAHDKLASEVVRFWASLAEENGTPYETTEGAKRVAMKMEKWPTRKIPD